MWAHHFFFKLTLPLRYTHAHNLKNETHYWGYVQACLCWDHRWCPSELYWMRFCLAGVYIHAFFAVRACVSVCACGKTVVLVETVFIIRQVNIYPLGYHLPLYVFHRLPTNVLVMLPVCRHDSCCWDNHYPSSLWDSWSLSWYQSTLVQTSHPSRPEWTHVGSDKWMVY